MFPERATELSITVGLVADLQVFNPFDFFIEEYAEHYGFAYPAELAADLEPYLRRSTRSGPAAGPARSSAQWLSKIDITADETPRSSTSWCRSTPPCRQPSATRCGWSRACRPPTTP